MSVYSWKYSVSWSVGTQLHTISYNNFEFYFESEKEKRQEDVEYIKNNTQNSTRKSFINCSFEWPFVQLPFGIGLMLRASRIHVASFTCSNRLHIYIHSSILLRRIIFFLCFFLLSVVVFFLLIRELFTATAAMTTTSRRHVDCKVFCNWSVEMANEHAREGKKADTENKQKLK